MYVDARQPWISFFSVAAFLVYPGLLPGSCSLRLTDRVSPRDPSLFISQDWVT